jgi:ribosomal protein S19
MSRSLYKPCIPSDLRLYNISPKKQAFYRGEDMPRSRVIRLLVRKGDCLITPQHIRFWILLDSGKRAKRLVFVRSQHVGHVLGSLRRTKRGGRIIHAENKPSRKLQKLKARLRMEAKRRKTKKKPSTRITKVKDKLRKIERKKREASVTTQVVKKAKAKAASRK